MLGKGQGANVKAIQIQASLYKEEKSCGFFGHESC